MPRKKKSKRKPRPLQVKITRVHTPKGVTPAQYWRALKEATTTAELPEGWEVELSWRNPTTKKGRSKDWQTGEFGDVISDSREGFATVVQRAISHAAAKARAAKPRAAKAKPKSKSKQGRLFV